MVDLDRFSRFRWVACTMPCWLPARPPTVTSADGPAPFLHDVHGFCAFARCSALRFDCSASFFGHAQHYLIIFAICFRLGFPLFRWVLPLLLRLGVVGLCGRLLFLVSSLPVHGFGLHTIAWRPWCSGLGPFTSKSAATSFDPRLASHMVFSSPSRTVLSCWSWRLSLAPWWPSPFGFAV